MTDPVNNQIEVNIEHVWESVAAGSRDVLQKSNLSPSTIAGVCVGAIMHVPVPIDENGTLLLRQVQIYSDKRCKDYVRAFQSTPEALRAYKNDRQYCYCQLAWLQASLDQGASTRHLQKILEISYCQRIYQLSPNRQYLHRLF